MSRDEVRDEEEREARVDVARLAEGRCQQARLLSDVDHEEDRERHGDAAGLVLERLLLPALLLGLVGHRPLLCSLNV